MYIGDDCEHVDNDTKTTSGPRTGPEGPAYMHIGDDCEHVDDDARGVHLDVLGNCGPIFGQFIIPERIDK